MNSFLKNIVNAYNKKEKAIGEENESGIDTSIHRIPFVMQDVPDW